MDFFESLEIILLSFVTLRFSVVLWWLPVIHTYYFDNDKANHFAKRATQS